MPGTTPKTVRSYVAEYWSTDGKTLLGGVMRSRSSRWGLRSDAESFLSTTIENNENSGSHCAGRVVPSPLPPEIFPHCEGAISQALGGQCFRCGKVLTAADARAHKAA